MSAHDEDAGAPGSSAVSPAVEQTDAARPPVAPDNTAAPETDVDVEAGLWAMPRSHLFVMLAACLFTAVATVSAYHLLQRRSATPPLATVDLQGVIEAKELQFTEIITKPGITDADRAQAYELVARIGSEVERAVEQLGEECECVVLVRAAVVGRSLPDLTESLRQKMGVADLDVAAVRERLRNAQLNTPMGQLMRGMNEPGAPPSLPNGTAAR